MLTKFLYDKGLSRREAEICELMTKGLINREIGDQLCITEKTVKYHLTNIYRKMEVKGRMALVVVCLPQVAFIDSATIAKVATTPSEPIEAPLPTGIS